MAMLVGSSRAKSDINVTPFVDIVLLLIIFMVVTPMMSSALDISIPPEEPRKAPEGPLDQWVASVRGPDPALRVYLNHQEIPGGVSGVKERIAEVLRGRRDRLVFFQADPGLRYEDVVNVMDKVREGGAEKLGLVTDESLGLTRDVR